MCPLSCPVPASATFADGIPEPYDHISPRNESGKALITAAVPVANVTESGCNTPTNGIAVVDALNVLYGNCKYKFPFPVCAVHVTSNHKSTMIPWRKYHPTWDEYVPAPAVVAPNTCGVNWRISPFTFWTTFSYIRCNEYTNSFWYFTTCATSSLPRYCGNIMLVGNVNLSSFCHAV